MKTSLYLMTAIVTLLLVGIAWNTYHKIDFESKIPKSVKAEWEQKLFEEEQREYYNENIILNISYSFNDKDKILTIKWNGVLVEEKYYYKSHVLWFNGARLTP